MKQLYTSRFYLYCFLFSIIFQQVHAQIVLFEEEVVDSVFFDQIVSLQNKYDAKKVRCTTFEGIEKDQELMIKTFDDNSYLVDFMRKETYFNGSKTWVGKIRNQPHSSVIFGESQGMWCGRIQDENGEQYLILPLNQMEIFVMIKLGDHEVDEGNDAIVSSNFRNNSSTSRSSMVGVCDVGSTCAASTIDLMLVYTPSITANYGGKASVEASFATWVADLNMINANSGVSHRFNLRYSQEVNYTETTSASTDLNWVSSDATVAALRNAHGADLVALITDVPRSVYCGFGYLNDNPAAYDSNAAFSVSTWVCAGANRTLAHEIGHNMGLRHDRSIDKEDTPCVEAHGYVNQAAFASGAPASKRWRTIMAYDNQCNNAGFSCNRLPYWSNPSLTQTGDPLGSTTAGAEANATYLLERAGCLVKEFRQHPIGSVTASMVTCVGNDATCNLQFTTTNGSGAYMVYNSTTVFDASTLVGAINGQAANGSITIPIKISGPTSSGNTMLRVRDAVHPGCDATVTVTLPDCPLVCSINSDGLSNVVCNDNGTGQDITDDKLLFDLNPVGNNLGITYLLSVDDGSIFPTSANYGTATSFYIENGLVGNNTVTITAGTCTKEINIATPTDCFLMTEVMISDPCSCEDPLNVKNGAGLITHFHDILRIVGNGPVILTATDGVMLDNALLPFQVGDVLGTAAGVFNRDFFHASGASGIISVSVGGSNLNNFQLSICNADQCSDSINTGSTDMVNQETVPTMSEWGVILFGLLILNLSLVLLERKEEEYTT